MAGCRKKRWAPNPENTKEAQNRNGNPGPNFASQFPLGGAKTLAMPITDIPSPVADPAKRAPIPLTSMIAVIRNRPLRKAGNEHGKCQHREAVREIPCSTCYADK